MDIGGKSSYDTDVLMLDSVIVLVLFEFYLSKFSLYHDVNFGISVFVFWTTSATVVPCCSMMQSFANK